MSSRGLTTKGVGYSLSPGDNTLPIHDVDPAARTKAVVTVLSLASDPGEGARDVLDAVGLTDVPADAVRAALAAHRRGSAA